MPRYGIALHEPTPAATLDGIARADALGVPTVWLTSGSAEPMTILAAAAAQTSRVMLGTAVVPLYPRHPVILAQQAAVVDAVAPGRLRLGVGPSHQPIMEGMFGLKFEKPLGHLREYVAVLRQALESGTVDFDGEFYRVHLPTMQKAAVPLYVSALREASFRLAGDVADGAQAWICPAPYLARVARPALEAAGRKAALLAHCFLCVNTDADTVRADARERLAMYPKLPFYARMLEQAGLHGDVLERLVDAVVIHGSEAECSARLEAFAEEATADEVICSLMRIGDVDAAMRVVASL